MIVIIVIMTKGDSWHNISIRQTQIGRKTGKGTLGCTWEKESKGSKHEAAIEKCLSLNASMDAFRAPAWHE
eukprot:6550600-Karenia_brevis.AAC.1